MERKNFAVLCAAVLCFWLFALALGTAEGVGLRAVMHQRRLYLTRQHIGKEAQSAHIHTDDRRTLGSHPARRLQIGRASCRERV